MERCRECVCCVCCEWANSSSRWWPRALAPTRAGRPPRRRTASTSTSSSNRTPTACAMVVIVALHYLSRTLPPPQVLVQQPRSRQGLPLQVLPRRRPWRRVHERPLCLPCHGGRPGVVHPAGPHLLRVDHRRVAVAPPPPAVTGQWLRLPPRQREQPPDHGRPQHGRRRGSIRDQVGGDVYL